MTYKFFDAPSRRRKAVSGLKVASPPGRQRECRALRARLLRPPSLPGDPAAPPSLPTMSSLRERLCQCERAALGPPWRRTFSQTNFRRQTCGSCVALRRPSQPGSKPVRPPPRWPNQADVARGFPHGVGGVGMIRRGSAPPARFPRAPRHADEENSVEERGVLIGHWEIFPGRPTMARNSGGAAPRAP